MPTKKALEEASKRNLDLVLIAPKAPIPVAKIMDYGKYKFERKKKESEAKKNQTKIEQKEVRITPNIGKHDMETKAKHAIKFLQKGNRVKVSLQFRGRENANKEFGMQTMQNFLKLLEEDGTIEKAPKLGGRFLDAYLVPKKK